MSWEETLNQHIKTYEKECVNYPVMHRVATLLRRPVAPVIGRDQMIQEIREGLRNPEKANIILLGDAGSGKTAIVKAYAYSQGSEHQIVLAIDIEKFVLDLSADKESQISNGFDALVREMTDYARTHDVIINLFIDEFHRIQMLSPSSVEALKPILEESGSVGCRIIAATTLEEYDTHISWNKALDQRLLRITLSELPKDVVISILRSRAMQHGVYDITDETVYDEIYHYAKHILISNSQPRASIDMLNNMIARAIKYERMEDGKLVRDYYTSQELGLPGNKVLNRTLLNRVIRSAYGIDIDNKVPAKRVREVLNQTIFNQEKAIEEVMKLIESMLAGFNDDTRPKKSFLSTGATGVGKTELAKQISEVLGVPLKRFDMSYYSRPEDAREFANDLAHAAWSAPNAYILIDEIEKSTQEAMNILLQVLDDARLVAGNNSNRVISFSGCIINMTTNLGSEQYQHMKRFGDEDSRIDVEGIHKSLEANPKLNSAVLGRINAIVPFAPLPDSAYQKIAEREIKRYLPKFETDKRQVLLSPDVIPYITIDHTSSDTERGGARDVKRNVENLLLGRVASYLAQEPEEVPIIIYVKGRARFKYEDVGDSNNASIDIIECHPKQKVATWLEAIGNKAGTIYYDEGLFVPNTWTVQDLVNLLIPLSRQGVRRFRTMVDEERVFIAQG